MNNNIEIINRIRYDMERIRDFRRDESVENLIYSVQDDLSILEKNIKSMEAVDSKEVL